MAQAQTTAITGRVVSRASQQPLPGVTVVERGTTNGCSTGADGRFSLLPVPTEADSLLLTVSSIGFTTRVVRVAVGGYREIALDSSRVAPYDGRHLWYAMSLFSGGRYAPFGAAAQLLGTRFASPSLTYQTNFRRNHALHANLTSYDWSRNGGFIVRGLLDYHRVQAVSANLRFSAYTATLGLRKYRIGSWRGPELLLTTGYAWARPIATDGGTRAGVGYGLGLRHELFPYPFRLLADIHTTRWPGYWQHQGQLLYQFYNYRFRAGIATHWLPRYREISLVFSYILDKPSNNVIVR